MGKFTDFARAEIYALLRLTAILTTFFMAAGFTIFAFQKGELGCWVVKGFFYFLIGTGVLTIGLVWLHSWRTIIKYYARMDDEGFEETDIYKNITARAGKCRKLIWFTFLACLIFFIAFLVGVLLSSW